MNDHARVTGGADVYCLELDRLLRERGHEVRFLSTAHPENLTDRGAFIPQIVSLGSRDSLGPAAAAGVARAALWNQTGGGAPEGLIADFAPDVVHAQKLYPQLSVAPVVAAARAGVPVVQTVHDYEFVSASAFDDRGSGWDRDEDRLAYRILNSLLFAVKRAFHLRRVAAWIAVSRDLAGVCREHGVEATALPNFVAPDPRPVAPYGERRGALSVGRLAVEKGIDDVIGLARLLPGLPVAVAGHGPLASRVAAAAGELANLEFLGALEPEEVARRMRGARLVVMPSAWREPAGLVAVEAMRAGTPVLAYERGGLAEYVGDAGAGLVLPPSLEALARAVAGLDRDRVAWERCSAAGVAAAAGTHSPDTYMDRLEDIYEGVRSGRSAARIARC